MSTQNSLINCEGLTFGYGTDVVIKNAFFTVPKVKAACIVGSNGCGKTTLCKLFMGALKPQSGLLEVLGQSPVSARSQIGYLPQYVHIDSQFPVSVMDIVLTGRIQANSLFGYSKADKEAAEKSITSIGLSAYMKKSFSSLSGGQKRRVLIARALANEPKLLIMDEPTANVDPIAENALLETLQELDDSISVLLVSHQFDFVSHYVEQVICVHGAGQVCVHPTTEITPEHLQHLYGGSLRVVRHDINASH